MGMSGRRNATGSLRAFSSAWRDDLGRSSRNMGSACGVMMRAVDIMSVCRERDHPRSVTSRWSFFFFLPTSFYSYLGLSFFYFHLLVFLHWFDQASWLGSLIKSSIKESLIQINDVTSKTRKGSERMEHLADAFFGLGVADLGAAVATLGVEVHADAAVAGGRQDLVQLGVPLDAHHVRFGHLIVVDSNHHCRFLLVSIC